MGVGAVIGVGLGIYAGVKNAEAEKQAKEEKRAREAAFNAKSNTAKIEEVRQTLDEAQKQGNTEVVDKCNDLIALLQEQKALVNQINNELNQLTQEQALITAKVGDKYLTDMSIVALQNAGQDAIIKAYAEAIKENGGLLGYELFDNEGNLTDAGYDYLLGQLKQSGDDEIDSVLSGGAYTLSEILTLRKKYGDAR